MEPGGTTRIHSIRGWVVFAFLFDFSSNHFYFNSKNKITYERLAPALPWITLTTIQPSFILIDFANQKTWTKDKK